jgi:hypothetical protein
MGNTNVVIFYSFSPSREPCLNDNGIPPPLADAAPVAYNLPLASALHD